MSETNVPYTVIPSPAQVYTIFPHKTIQLFKIIFQEQRQPQRDLTPPPQKKKKKKKKGKPIIDNTSNLLI